MTKNDLIAALEKIHGDPEIEVTLLVCDSITGRLVKSRGEIDRINEIPSPEIVIIEK